MGAWEMPCTIPGLAATESPQRPQTPGRPLPPQTHWPQVPLSTQDSEIKGSRPGTKPPTQDPLCWVLWVTPPLTLFLPGALAP